MQINNKYKIGQSAYCIRNNRIEKIIIGNFHLDYDTSKSLEERLQYEMKLPDNAIFHSVTIYNKTRFKESELFDSIDELIESLKNEYNK